MVDQIATLLAEINKRYGTCVAKASEAPGLIRDIRIPTGVLSLDAAFGGGFPVGRIAIVKGEFSSGKTAVALKIAAAFQRTCRNCWKPMFQWNDSTLRAKEMVCCKTPVACKVLWIDVEHNWKNAWSKRLGVDVDATYVMQSEFAEQIVDASDALMRSGAFDLMVLDSIAFISSSEEIGKSAEDKQMGDLARVMAKATRKWISAMNAGSLYKQSFSMLLLNQIRVKINRGMPPGKSSPGGKAVEQIAHVHCEVRKVKYHTLESGVVVAHDMEAVFTKNKTAQPFRTAQFRLNLVRMGANPPGSTDVASQAVRLGEYWGLVKKEGSWYSCMGKLKAQGVEQLAAALSKAENAGTLNLLLLSINQKEAKFRAGDEQDLPFGNPGAEKKKKARFGKPEKAGAKEAESAPKTDLPEKVEDPEEDDDVEEDDAAGE